MFLFYLVIGALQMFFDDDDDDDDDGTCLLFWITRNFWFIIVGCWWHVYKIVFWCFGFVTLPSVSIYCCSCSVILSMECRQWVCCAWRSLTHYCCKRSLLSMLLHFVLSDFCSVYSEIQCVETIYKNSHVSSGRTLLTVIIQQETITVKIRI